MKKFTLTIIAFYLTASFMAQNFSPLNGMGTKQLDDDENTVVPPIANKGASKDLLDLLFYQPMFDGTGSTAQNSTLDTSNGIDYETADNFWEVEESIEKIIFYGLASKYIGGIWVDQIPSETEPFLIRFYNFEFGVDQLIAPQTGTYKLALLDSYGDGWNNGMITVSINGTPVLSNITLEHGYGPYYHEFSANQGDLISTTYTPGNWSYENYYAILDPSDNIIAEQGGTWDTPWTSTPISIGTGEPIVLEPNWANPLSAHSLNAAVENAGTIWNGARTLYKFTVFFTEPIELETAWVSAQIDADNGSGTSFLWMSGQNGDNTCWQRVPNGAKNAISTFINSSSFVPDETVRSGSKEQKYFDLSLELWGGMLTDPPDCVTLLTPANELADIPQNVTLSWNSNPIADGYLLLIGESLPEDGIDLGNVTSHNLVLQYSTTYQWTILPYNTFGPADGCEVRTFTVMDDPTLYPPFNEDFNTAPFPPINWTRFRGLLTENTALTTGFAWFHNNFGNLGGSNNSAYINIYGIRDHWLITAPIYLGDGNLNHFLAFDFALTPYYGNTQTSLGLDDYVAVVISLDNGTTWSNANMLQSWDSNSLISNTGNQVVVDLSDYSGLVKIGFYVERPYGLDPNLRLYVDNVTVEPFGDCSEPLGLNATNINYNSAIISWVQLGNSGTWNIQWGLAGFEQGTGLLAENIQSNPYLLQGLLSNTSYEFYVQAVCSDNGLSGWTGPYHFKTECAADILPFTESFDLNISPDCWYQTFSGGVSSNRWIVSNTNLAGGSPYEMRANSLWGTGVSRLVSPPLDLTGINYPVLQFKHSYVGSSEGATFKIQSSTNGVTWVDEAFLFSSQDGNISKEIVSVLLTNISSSTRLAWVIEGSHSSFNNWYIDDILVEDLGVCPKPYGLSVANISANSATLSWDQVGNANTWNIQWGLAGFEEGTGFLAENIQSSPYFIQDLSSNTSYEFYVQTICEEKSTSTWAGPFLFKTECENFILPYAESFDLNQFPDCWSQTYSGGVTSNRWIISNSNQAGGTRYEMRATYTSGTGVTRLISPAFNLLETESPILEFKHYYSDYGSGLIFKIQSSPDGLTWVDEEFSFTSGSGSIGSAIVTVPITTKSETTYVAWVIDGNHWNFNYWYVDDVFIDDGVCPRPFNITVSNNTTTSADLNWGQWGDIDYWNLEWGPAGFDQGSGTMITNIESTPFNLSSLSLGTAYDFYVQTVCLSSETSEWSGPIRINTLAEGDNCSNAFDLSSMASPYSGTITTANNHFNFCYMGSYKDLIFYYDVEPNYGIRIWQSWNNFTSRHTMRWGGACPGENEIDCIFTPRTAPISWINTTGETQRVWFIIAGYSQGQFTLEWEYYSCFATNIPYTESFDNPWLPNCWNQTISGSINSNVWSTSNTSNTGGAPYEMRASRISGTGISRLISAPVDLSSTSNPVLEFNHFFKGVAAGCALKIQSSTDGINWIDEAFSFNSIQGNIGPEFISMPLITKSSTTYLSFTIEGNHWFFENWFIDDIFVDEGSCPRPFRLTATNITPSSADLGWEQWGIVNSWNVQWGLEGFELGNGIMEGNLLNSMLSLSGLFHSTFYEFYVQANCEGDESSNWSGPFRFQTGKPLSVTISAIPDNICSGSTTQLSVVASDGYGDYSYSWTSDPPWFFSDLPNPSAIPIESTTFSVVVSDNVFAVEESIIVDVYETAPIQVTNLLPSNGTIIPNTRVTFSWQPSITATNYNIFVWRETDPIPQNPIATNLTTIQYTYSGLSYATTYNWKVVALNPCGETTSETMTFSVAELPDLIVSNILVPESPFSGQQVEISWTVFNQGNNGTLDKTWLDLIYLSEDATLDETDIYLGGVQNLASLPINTGYTNSRIVTIPNGNFGNKFIIVKTDSYNNVIEEDEDNNVSSAPIAITLTPPPDLVVTNIVVPTVAFSGQTITVNWTTTNQGTGGIQNKSWVDRIYLSLEEEFNAASSTFLGQQTFTQSLAPGENYNGSRNVTLPSNIFGDYYIYVITDFFDHIYEHANEENNISRSSIFEILLTPPPDLTVLNIQHPGTASNSEQITISYLNHNMGGTQTLNAWWDKIWLCPESVFDEGISIDLGVIRRNITLDPGQSAQANFNTTVPATIHGGYYIFVHTDHNDLVFEHTNTDNNLVRSTSPTQVNHADLTVASVEVPISAFSGEEVSIEWSLSNVGAGKVINKTIVDKIFISNSQDFANSDPEEIGSLTYTTNLNPGQTVIKTHNVKIPDGISGQHFLFAFTNTTNTVFENDLEDNNFASTPITINLSPYPDLEVTSFSTPSAIDLGYGIEIIHTVTNSGTLAIDGKTWKDAVFASTSQVFDKSNVLKLNEFIEGPDLATGESYSRTNEVVVPIKDFKNQSEIFLHILSDFENKIFEMDKDNNIATSGSISVSIPPRIDLEATAASTPVTSTKSGNTVNFSYTVENISTPTHVWDVSEWKDAIFLSTNSTWDSGDLLISDWLVVDVLETNETYTVNGTFLVPNGIHGNYFFILVADHQNLVDDANLSNNSISISGEQPIFVEQTYYPDLKVEMFESPLTATAGQPIKFKWEVSNIGEGPTTSSSWIDRVYLSTDYNISANDIQLANKTITTVLEVNQNYSDSIEVFLPANLSGNYILIFRTDANNNVFETGQGNANNVAFVGINILQALPCDLVVEDIWFTSPQQTGSTIRIDYTIKNIGTNPAQGYIRDIVYFSSDTILDINDKVFSQKGNIINLAPQMTVNLFMDAMLPGMLPDDYHILVKTNVLNNINELNFDNNTGTSTNTMEVDMPQLVMDELKVTQIHFNAPKYYQIEIPLELEGETLSLRLDSQHQNKVTEIYLSHESIPTRSNHGYSATVPFSANQELLVPTLSQGNYYLMVFENTSSGSTQNVELLATILPFEIRSINASQGGNTGSITVLISGAKFESHMTFKLSNESKVEIPAEDFTFINSTQAYATFNLVGVQPGLYSLIAEKNTSPATTLYFDPETAILSDGFEILEGGSGELSIYLRPPSGSRPGWISSVVIDFANIGNIDLRDRTIKIISQTSSPVALTVAGLEEMQTELIFHLQEKDGSPGVLRPGYQGQVTFFIKASAGLGFIIEY